jgi:phenylalanyl-tRNA synthetase alpha chain
MNQLKTNLNQIEVGYAAVIQAAKTSQQLTVVKSSYLGKNGSIQVILRGLSKLEAGLRREIGSRANRLKVEVEAAILKREKELTSVEDETQLATDLSLPIRCLQKSGHGHPTQLVLDDIYEVFLRLGYAIVDGPEVETDWYNFEALNMPPDHPARDMQDTFYVSSEADIRPLVPRTHTSAAQIRYLEKHQPPFKIIVPGKVYRNEDEDRTHSWTFFQVEGLVVGESVSMADLKGTLLHCVQSLLGSDVRVRFRPSFFPYTEPSVEVDVHYLGEWLEVGGAGMVHPHVLARGGVDPETCNGFAFGFGPDRLALIRYGLTDLRKLWRPNLLMSEDL